MKKTAVLIYNQFCNFEFSVALEMLAMSQKPVTIFAKDLKPVRSEEGLNVIPDKTIEELQIEEYDSLILTGAADIREALEDERILEFIKEFDNSGRIIGAISIAPILLLKIGTLKGKPFMAGVNKEDLIEEGFSMEEMAEMVGWDDNLETPVAEGYMITDNIITSVSYNFVKWALAFGKMIGIDINPKTFGLES